ncbi:flippase [Candidatus Daviesbacteria bacterium]|nr:flippase [Candidatus Daviesbacteria bacterium]
MQKVKKIFQQTFWQAVFKVVTTSGGFVILGIVSRNYGEAGLGDFTLALTYLAFFYVLADFGFNGYILRRLQESNFSLEWRKLLGIRILWGAFLTILAAVLPLVFAPGLVDFKLAVLVGVLTIFLNSLFFCAQALIQVNLKYEYSTWPVFLSAPAGVLLIFYLSSARAPVYLLTVGYVLSWLIYTGLLLLLVRRIIKQLSPIFSKKYLVALFQGSFPLAATLFLNVIYFRADAFIISFYKGSAEVGIYNVAYQVFQSILVLPTFIMNSFYPMMLQTLKNNIDRFGYQIKMAALGLLFLSFSILLVIYYLSPLIIKLITGTGFAGSATSLQILSLGLPAYFLSALLMWMMVAKKMYKKMLLIYSLGLVTNIALNFIFIPRYSYVAASWITGISEYLILGLQAAILLRK